ncbi:MAG: metallophosphoesterase [candidate division Zixibacteria bacterium]|nr:metallophosphoesterase [candidate division Zixibacteria bacterium]
MKMFATIITIASLIIVLAHAGVYFSWLKFFQITDPGFRRGLAIALFVLSISFIIGSMLVHRYQHGLSGAIYLVSAIWLGAFLYILMSVVLTWAFAGVSALIAGSAHFRPIAMAFLAIAVGFSLYGLWSAANPRVTEITVPIRNLPSSWEGRRIAQISDVHLGAINRTEFMKHIVEEVNSVNPDMVVITGDLFDGVGDDLRKLVHPLAELHPPLGTFFITGNHETYHGVDSCIAALDNLPIKVLRNEIVDLDGVQLLGIEYPLREQKIVLDTILQRLQPGKPTIALFHIPSGVEVFKKYGVNLLLCGHTHVGQMWPFNYITHSVYHGYDYGLKTDGDFSIYTNSGAGSWGPPYRTNVRPEVAVVTVTVK